MTSHETRTFTTRNKSAASDQNDLKKLKSKYSAKLPTLKVLFSDWSDDDLLFVLEEANGDLDIAIDRISEGHANQWGEVKTKKSKKEAQKAKAATTVSTNQQQSTLTPYRDTTPTKPTPTRSNHSRAGKASSTQRTRTPKSNSIQTVSWDNQPKASSQEAAGGSWASIAKQHSDTVSPSHEDSWNATNDNVPAADEWGPAASSHTAQQDVTSRELPDDDQPKTWASLLKSKPKNDLEQTTNDDENTSNDWDAANVNTSSSTDAWEAPTTSNVNISSSGWDAPNEPTVDEWSTPVREATPIENNEPVKEEQVTESFEKEVEPEIEPTPLSDNLLKEQEPVVLPSDTSAISNLDVKFGSLAVNEDNAVEETVKESVTSVETPREEPAPTATTTPPASAPVTEPTYLKQQEPVYSQTAANTTAAPQPQQQQQQQQPQQPIPQQQQQQVPQQVPQQVFQQPIPQQHQQQQQQQQPMLQQQQQQQQAQQQQQLPQQPQQAGMDHLTSAYSSYLPNQPPAGVSGFGMNPMGNLPDYGIYSTEAQRAAAMGYYDPTAFSHSPSVTSTSVYQSRDKYTQEAGLHGQTGQPQQQMYPSNLPYYQYYYMPNQFNAYQQSGYGQPFMNKSMYPNMYQQLGKPTNAGAAQSPYGSVSSPYGQQQSQLYNHQYDDLSMGLNDYQKYSQNQYQGFLGNLNGQPQPQQQQPSAQQGQKQSDISRSNSTGNAAGTPQQQPQQPQQPQQLPQQQPQQQIPQQQQQQQYTNYFGQPQMFSYGQYPQYQQQMPLQQPQQSTRQQQYWNQ